ncbi:MAG: hypothetical protein ACJATP_001189 [Candidatus Azotimanducaceae bacterium]|jgi:hypothetical protein
MSNPWFLVPFVIGTLAFFATLYVTMVLPKLSDTPWHEDDADEVHPLRQWDTVITWIMWGGWGVAMLMRFLDRGKLLDQVERLIN